MQITVHRCLYADNSTQMSTCILHPQQECQEENQSTISLFSLAQTLNQHTYIYAGSPSAHTLPYQCTPHLVTIPRNPPPPPSLAGTSGGKPVHHLPLQLGPDTQHPPLVLGVEEVEHQSLRLAVPAEELSDGLRQLPVLRLIAAVSHETGKQIIRYHCSALARGCVTIITVTQPAASWYIAAHVRTMTMFFRNSHPQPLG